MKISRLTLIPFILVAVGCGSERIYECDSGPYQTAVRAPKVQAPEGLDNLDPLNEVPLPAASPQQPRPEGSPCLEEPPRIIRLD